MHSARLDGQLRIVKRLNAREAFADAFHSQKYVLTFHTVLLLPGEVICFKEAFPSIVNNYKECGGPQLSPSALSHLRIDCLRKIDHSPVYIAYGMVTIQPSTWP